MLIKKYLITDIDNIKSIEKNIIIDLYILKNKIIIKVNNKIIIIVLFTNFIKNILINNNLINKIIKYIKYIYYNFKSIVYIIVSKNLLSYHNNLGINY
jgi:hypothetical protein